jgi:hypothetical protein
LDCIWLALSMSDAKIGTPIRQGEKRARIKLDLGEIIVERKFTEGGSTLTVSNADGARYPSPQKMLDALIGALSFDPLAFTRKDGRKQFEELRRVVKLDVDIDALSEQNKTDFDARTEVNRQAKTKRTLADSIKVTPGLPEKPVDETALLNQIQAAAVGNTEIETRRANREQARRDIIALRNRAEQLRDEATELRRRADAVDVKAAHEDAEAAKLQTRLDEAPALPEPVDITALRTQLDAAKATNVGISNRETRKRIESEASALEKRADELTDAMAAREKQKQDAVAAAQMPVSGLGFGDGEITYNGVPFSQASAAEQLRVSMAIAMASNPKLRVIRITDGSLLDEDSMRAIGDMAKAGDFQVWCEVVDSSGKVGIVIEDGTVVAVNEPAAEAA